MQYVLIPEPDYERRLNKLFLGKFTRFLWNSGQPVQENTSDIVESNVTNENTPISPSTRVLGTNRTQEVIGMRVWT